MRLLLVTNAAAGTADRENVERALSVLRAEADVREAACAAPEDLGALLDVRDGRQLVLAGGDGSLHSAVTALRARGELSPHDPLGVLPLGTGNDLARTLGIPLDVEEAAAALLNGVPRRLDLIVDDAGGVVVNVVHLGAGVEAAETASGMKDSLGKAAYVVGAAVAGISSSGWDVRVEVDGLAVNVDEPVLLVAVCNGRSIGGGAELAPDALIDDGQLDVVVATSTGLLARLGFGVAVRSGEHVDRHDVLVVRGKTVTVRGQSFRQNADGELGEPIGSRTWKVEPRAWAITVP